MTKDQESENRKLRVYVDATVVSSCEDEEFREHSQSLIEAAKAGKMTLIVSDVTLEELLHAPLSVRQVLPSIPLEHLEVVGMTRDVWSLADGFIEAGALTEKFRRDALHIAYATVLQVDSMVTWDSKYTETPSGSVRNGSRKAFDCVKWTEKVRGRIYLETEGHAFREEKRRLERIVSDDAFYASIPKAVIPPRPSREGVEGGV